MPSPSFPSQLLPSSLSSTPSLLPMSSLPLYPWIPSPLLSLIPHQNHQHQYHHQTKIITPTTETTTIPVPTPFILLSPHSQDTRLLLPAPSLSQGCAQHTMRVALTPPSWTTILMAVVNMTFSSWTLPGGVTMVLHPPRTSVTLTVMVRQHWGHPEVLPGPLLCTQRARLSKP